MCEGMLGLTGLGGETGYDLPYPLERKTQHWQIGLHFFFFFFFASDLKWIFLEIHRSVLFFPTWLTLVLWGPRTSKSKKIWKLPLVVRRSCMVVGDQLNKAPLPLFHAVQTLEDLRTLLKLKPHWAREQSRVLQRLCDLRQSPTAPLADWRQCFGCISLNI